MRVSAPFYNHDIQTLNVQVICFMAQFSTCGAGSWLQPLTPWFCERQTLCHRDTSPRTTFPSSENLLFLLVASICAQCQLLECSVRRRASPLSPGNCLRPYSYPEHGAPNVVSFLVKLSLTASLQIMKWGLFINYESLALS